MEIQTVAALIEACKTEAKAKEQRRSMWRATYATKLVEVATGGSSAQRPDYVLVGNSHIPVPGLTPGGDDARSATEDNFGFPFIDSMVASICPSTHPQITVNARRKALREAARYRETLCNDDFRRTNYRNDLWKAAALAGVVGEAFIKVVWDPNHKAPDFLVRDPLFVWYDSTADSWDRVGYVIEALVITKEEFDSRVAQGLYDAGVAALVTPSGYPAWLQTEVQRQLSRSEKAARQVLEWVVLYEAYDLRGKKFYHFADGITQPLMQDRLPYKLIKNPYYRVNFNDALIDMTPLSDIELIFPILRQLNDLTTLNMRHALSTIPIDMVDENGVDNVDAFIDSRRTAVNPGDMIRVATKDGRPLDSVVKSTTQPSMTVDFRIAQQDRREQIQFILGQPAYQRGQQSGADMATEVALMDSALRTRNGRRQQIINEAIAWAAEACMALRQEYMPDNEVIYARYALKTPVEITRSALSLGEIPAEDVEDSPEPEPQFLFDYQVVPGASVENTRLVKLKAMKENWQIIEAGIQMGIVDGGAAIKEFLELLQLDSIMKDPEEQVAQPLPIGKVPTPGEEPPPEPGTAGSPGGPPGSPEEAIAEAGESPLQMTGRAIAGAKAIPGVLAQ